jgi:hypothetical protein
MVAVRYGAKKLRPQHQSKNKKTSAFYRRWRDRAGQLLRRAAVSGRVSIVASKSTGKIGVPPDIILLMNTNRGALKSVPTFGDQTDPSVLNFIRLLEGSKLFIPEEDFWKFYELIPSSSGPLAPAQRGRPTKQTESLKAKIWQVILEGKWRGESASKLHDILRTDGISVSYRTTLRVLDQLYDETADHRILRRHHTKRIPSNLPKIEANRSQVN